MKVFKIVFLFICLTRINVNAQHTNTGATITIEAGLNVYADDDLINSSGTINNSGNLYISGDFTNNSTFNPSAGTVYLNGGNQTIGGSTVTTFHNLTLSGSGIKSLSTSANIAGNLDLANRELSTGSSSLHITNTSSSAISRTSGFVSSSSGGSLIRSTAESQIYLFPVGTSQGTTRYRPVNILPQSSVASVFNVRMVGSDATAGGYNRSSTDGIISGLNANYYHLINRTAGTSSVSVSIFYDTGSESFSSIAHWSGSQWEDQSPVTYASSGSLSGITIHNLTSFSPFIFGINDTAAIPTLSQWGVIILMLLTLTIVSLLIGRKKVVIAGAGEIDFNFYDLFATAPFDKRKYLKILKCTIPAAVAGFSLIHLFFGSNGVLDLSGTLVSTFIITYIIFLFTNETLSEDSSG